MENNFRMKFMRRKRCCSSRSWKAEGGDKKKEVK
jgi:hypothetical protein